MINDEQHARDTAISHMINWRN